MKNIKFILFALLGIFIFSCEEPEVVDFSFDGTSQNLFESELGDVSLFYEAVVKAGLDGRLSGSEEFTYLAPGNSAMQLALQNAGYSTVNDAPAEFLATLVNNHTIAGSVTSGQFEKSTIETVSGETVYVSVTEEGVIFNAKATVTGPDNVTTNGVVHVINYPLTSFPSNSIAGIVNSSATADSLPEFTVLNAALEAAGLAGTLGQAGEFTVFAPTDAAFAARGYDASNITAVDVEVLREILSYHVLEGRNFSVDLATGRYYTLQGEAGEKGIDLEVSNSSIEVNGTYGAEATSLNLLASNGTIHVVNDLVLPRPYIVDAITFNTLGDVNPSPLAGAGNAQFFLGAFIDVFNNTTLDVNAIYRTEDTVSVMATYLVNSEPDEVLNKQSFASNLDISEAVGTKITSIGGDSYFVTEGFNGLPYINGRTRPIVVQDFFNAPGDNRPLINDFSTYNGLLTVFISEFTPLPEISADAAMEDYADFSLFNAAVKFLELGNIPNATYLAVADSTFSSVYQDLEIAPNAAALDSVDVAALETVVNAHIVTEVFFGVDLDTGLQYTDLNGDDVDIIAIGASGDFGIRSENEGVISVINFGPTLDVLSANGVIHQVSGLRAEVE